MFKVTENKGFHMTFANGHTVSVQWGPGNYCDNYSRGFDNYREKGVPASNTAEVMVWNKDRNIPTPNEDGTMQDDSEYVDVHPNCSPEHVARIIAYVAALPA